MPTADEVTRRKKLALEALRRTRRSPKRIGLKILLGKRERSSGSGDGRRGEVRVDKGNIGWKSKGNSSKGEGGFDSFYLSGNRKRKGELEGNTVYWEYKKG